MAINKKDALIIGACEVTSGVLEAIVIPNLGKGKNEKFVVPGKKEILVSGLVLAISGVMAGYTADALLTNYKITSDQKIKRVLVIAGTVFTFNAIEAILVGNIVANMGNFSKYQLPTFRRFATQLSFLALTGVASGFFSSKWISATTPTAPVLAATSAQSLQKDINQILVDQTPADIALLNAQAAQTTDPASL